MKSLDRISIEKSLDPQILVDAETFETEINNSAARSFFKQFPDHNLVTWIKVKFQVSKSEIAQMMSDRPCCSFNFKR